MYKKIFLILVLTLFLNHCGFSPIHLNKLNNNFTITNLSFEGDRTINNFLKTNLYKFQNKNNEKKFMLNTNTKYEKKVISKDKTAKITKYELVAISTFEITLNNNFMKKLIISEKKIMNYIEDKFEEQKEETITKQNFATSISNKLLTELSILSDN